jgi:hypothetical protein
MNANPNIDQDSATEIPGANFPNKTDITTHKVRFTFLQDKSGSSLTATDVTLPELREMILAAKAGTKDDLPWLKGARFGDKASPKGSLRNDKNVLGFDAIELDYDKMVMSFDQAVATLKAMNVRALIYTTPTHANAAPRLRVLLPVSRHDNPLDTRAKLVARVNGRFGGIFAGESFTLSQGYYYGLALDNPAPDHRCEVIDGRFVDLCNELLKFQEAGAKTKKEKTQKPKVAPKAEDSKTKKTKVDGGSTRDAKFEEHLTSMGDGGVLLGFNGPLTSATSSYAYHHGNAFDREALKVRLREAINAAPKGGARKADDIVRYLSDEYLDGIIASGIEKFGTEQNDVERLNRVHAILPIGDKTRVVTFGELPAFPGRETIVMTQTINDFRSLQNKYRHHYHDKEGLPQSQPMGNHWINSTERRQYDGGMAFMPQHDGDVGNRLNLWHGFGVKAIKPFGASGEAGCRSFLGFMRTIICGGDEEHFDYLVKREALIFQKRIRSEVALGLMTKEEGCGKGFYEFAMRRLLGNHAMQATNPEHIIGKFNPHLETLLRLTADEALFVGNHKHRNSLFNLITEADLTIEPKNCGVYQADSFLNLSILSNSPHFLPVGDTSRRFFIPTVSTARMQDFEYFERLKTELENGGYEALLYHFLHEVDLKDFNVRKVPQTEGLKEQRDLSLEALDIWWVELLETGVLTGSDPVHPNQAVSNAYQREIKTEVVYGDKQVTQVRHVAQRGLYDQAKQIEPKLRNVSDHALGDHLTKMGCDNTHRILRRRGWAFPPLLKCRAAWEQRFPGWKWQNTRITAWCPEEGYDVIAKDGDPARHADWKAGDTAPKF